MHRVPFIATALLLSVSCSAGEPSYNLAPQGTTSAMLRTVSEQAHHSLAYTHNLQVKVAIEELDQIHTEVVDQCSNATEFTCVVLSSDISHSDYPSANVRMRVAPSGLETLTQTASGRGKTIQKSTSVEDLAEPIRDNSDNIKMLKAYLADLKDLREQSKDDIQGLIKVSSEIASVTTKIERALGQEAHLAARVELQILSIHLSVARNSSFTSPISRSFSDFGEDLSQGIAQAITGTAYVLPWLLILIPLLYLMRKLWLKTR